MRMKMTATDTDGIINKLIAVSASCRYPDLQKRNPAGWDWQYLVPQTLVNYMVT